MEKTAEIIYFGICRACPCQPSVRGRHAITMFSTRGAARLYKVWADFLRPIKLSFGDATEVNASVIRSHMGLEFQDTLIVLEC